MRALLNEAGALSVPNMAGTELPPRSRMMTTTFRLPPFRFRPSDGQYGPPQDWRPLHSYRNSRHHLRNLAFTAHNTALHFLSHGFPELVQENEGALL